MIGKNIIIKSTEIGDTPRPKIIVPISLNCTKGLSPRNSNFVKKGLYPQTQTFWLIHKYFKQA